MFPLNRLLFVLVLTTIVPLSLRGQGPVDPSGHWEGAVKMPDMELNIEIDFAKNSKGEFAGTFGQPMQAVKGLPLSTVVVDGRTARFVLKGGAGVSTFEGIVSADGKTLSGAATQGSESAPFHLTRTGEARIAPVPKNAPISKELEGTWNGVLEVDGRQNRVVLKLANQTDGTAKGTVVSPDGTGVEIPVGVVQKGANVTVDVASVGASFVGVLNANGTEIAGTWTQGSAGRLPVTFKK